MKIGEYEVVRLLGKGGMSEVYEVVNPRLGSRHALKLFVREKDEAEIRERFVVEAKLLSRLGHPRIVKVTDFGTDGESGRPYMVMELVLNPNGDTQLLADVSPGTVDEETVGRWYDDMREGLEYIHANGVVHRDLKLQNVLIGPDGHAVIADFGISKIFDVNGDGIKVVESAKTISKLRDGRELVMGSVGYMAPELEMGVAASPRSDWYALGVIVYRLLTGTWCDARTDVGSALETYDPAWRQIIPALLHANPEARKCISYSETRLVDQEQLKFELEEMCATAETGGRRLRIVASIAAIGAMATLAGLACVSFWALNVRGQLQAEKLRQLKGARVGDYHQLPYDFDAVFDIPREAGVDAQCDEDNNVKVPSLEDIRKTRNDLLVCTYDIFRNLREHPNEWDRALERLEKMRDDFEADAYKWPEDYPFQAGDNVTAVWMLNRGIEKMEELLQQ